jgi:hypothetical protein
MRLHRNLNRLRVSYIGISKKKVIKKNSLKKFTKLKKRMRAIKGNNLYDHMEVARFV